MAPIWLVIAAAVIGVAARGSAVWRRSRSQDNAAPAPAPAPWDRAAEQSEGQQSSDTWTEATSDFDGQDDDDQDVADQDDDNILIGEPAVVMPRLVISIDGSKASVSIPDAVSAVLITARKGGLLGVESLFTLHPVSDRGIKPPPPVGQPLTAVDNMTGLMQTMRGRGICSPRS